jgi:hypothetical protein
MSARGGWRPLLAALASLASACGSPSPSASDAASACGSETCTSSLVVTLAHELDFSAGGYVLELDVAELEVRCSFPAEATGTKSCFGYRFADLAWDESTITVTLTNPLSDYDVSVDVRLAKDNAHVFEQTVAVDPGEPFEPNGEGCPPRCWSARAEASLAGI